MTRLMSRFNNSLPQPATKNFRIRALPSFLRILLFFTVVSIACLLVFPLLRQPQANQIPIPPTFDVSSSSVIANNALVPDDRPFRIILIVPPFTYLPLVRHSSHFPIDNGDVSPASKSYTPEALGILIESLVTAHYDNEPISLDIVLAPEPNVTAFSSRYLLCDAAAWPHGTKSLRNATTGGLFELSVSSWNPAKADTEKVLIVDASTALPLSTQFYRYLKSVRRRYTSSLADIAGFALDPVLLRKASPVLGKITGEFASVAVEEGKKGDEVFLYQNLPFVPAFSPVDSDVWRAFQRWFAGKRSEWFLWPTVAGAKDKKDVGWTQYRGTARAHWSLWFSRFCAEYGIFTVYPRRRRPEPLPPVGRVNSLPPLSRFDFRGERYENKVQVDRDSLNKVIELGMRQGGSVSITIVNDAFVETARSWVCNVDSAGIRPPGVVWITTDEESSEAMRQVEGSQVVEMTGFRGGSKHAGTSYGTPGYWLLMLERTQLIRAILQRGIGVFLFETDQIWLRDPVPFVRRLVHSGDEVDVVGTMDTRFDIGGNFLFLNPTLATRRVWGEVCRRFAKAYKDNKMASHTAKFRRYMENDQSTLTKLIFFDQKFKNRNPVVFRALDTELFVDGQWYDDSSKKYTSPRSRSPIVINNNFLIGIANKKKRAKTHGHWFIGSDGKTCDKKQVLKAVRDNELRAPTGGQQTGDAVLDQHRRKAAVESASKAREDEDKALLKVEAAKVEGADVEAGLDEAMKAIRKELET